jgi:glycosyltransferase involved in cell wall biosynthesis
MAKQSSSMIEIQKNGTGKNMRVVHLSKCDINGGAYVAAYRLHQALLSIGVDSWMIVDSKFTDDPTVVGVKSGIQKIANGLASRLDSLPGRLMNQLDSNLSSYAWVPDRIAARVRVLNPDVINLHWINDGFMRIESLMKLQKPMIWTLHDMWPFSGARHYSFGENNYEIGYDSQRKLLNLDRWVWKRKKNIYANVNNLTVVAPSEWMGECAKKSILFQERIVKVIPYGLNQELFKPLKSGFARDVLGLPRDKKLVLFGAINGTIDKRKGFDLLQGAAKKLALSRRDIELIVFGSSKPTTDIDMGFPCHYLGRIQDERMIALIYNAADVFVIPSREDNLPNTVLEALSCGVPTVAFKIGGIPDMIQHKKNGYVATPFDTDDFAAGIDWTLKSKNTWEKLSKYARSESLKRFSFSLQARRYLQLYKKVVQ